jgi:hypothetical protein
MDAKCARLATNKLICWAKTMKRPLRFFSFPKSPMSFPKPSAKTYSPYLWALGVSIQVGLLVALVIYCPPAALGLLVLGALAYGIYSCCKKPQAVAESSGVNCEPRVHSYG